VDYRSATIAPLQRLISYRHRPAEQYTRPYGGLHHGAKHIPAKKIEDGRNHQEYRNAANDNESCLANKALW
jgi:hypothetical protein